jgi:cytochrome oxidase Cu insertion factor (SCO1/SenC/PrrC family)
MKPVFHATLAAAGLAFAGVLFAQEALKVGAPAPDFSAKDHNGNPVALKDFKGKKHVVLWFYPKANTGG